MKKKKYLKKNTKMLTENCNEITVRMKRMAIKTRERDIVHKALFNF